jgi:quercetin dioxygenase-like cupin family protein
MSLELIPNVSRTPEGLDGVTWNVLGQVYIPKEITDERFTWYAVFPEESFVPPHTHAAQDEYLMPLDGKRRMLKPGDVGHLPRGITHAFFNNTGKPVNALFWATPAGGLVELYRKLHNVGSPGKAVGIAPAYGVVFDPPISSAD